VAAREPAVRHAAAGIVRRVGLAYRCLKNNKLK